MKNKAFKDLKLTDTRNSFKPFKYDYSLKHR